MTNSKRQQAAAIDVQRYSLSVDERATVLALITKLNEIASELGKLIDGTLPPETQTQWEQLRQAFADTSAAVARRHRFNRWS